MGILNKTSVSYSGKFYYNLDDVVNTLGLSLGHIVWLLIKTSVENNKLYYVNFNGKNLYSDIVSLNTAYLKNFKYDWNEYIKKVDNDKERN